MTEETGQLTIDDETTLVAPRFDDEETVVARRVVPLEVAEAGARGTTQAAAPARKPRRPAVLALAFASALAGGVLGGVGLRLYQSRASSNPPPAANTNERAAAPNEAAQTAQAVQPDEANQPAQVALQPAAAADAANVSPAPAEQHDTSAGASESQPAPAAEPKAEDKPAANERDVDKPGANQPAKSSAAAARADSGDEARADARRRGKKGTHEEQGRLLGRRADSDRELSRDDDDEATFGGDLRGEARDPDATFARPRRASHHARHERRRPVDSIRGIFEGQPQ